MLDLLKRRALSVGALCCLILLGVAALQRSILGGEVLSTVGLFVLHGEFPQELKDRVQPGPLALTDPHRQFEPWKRYQAEHLERDGTLPFWKPTTLCGAPLLGNGQSAMFAPLNLAAVALGDPAWAQALIGLLKLSLGAFFAFLLARHLGLTPAASLTSAITFGFFGFQVAFLMFPHVMVSMLLPALVLAADRAAQRPTPGRISVLAAVGCLQHLGGHPETVVHCQAVAALLAVVRVLSLRASGRCARPVRTLLLVASGFVAGALLSAPHTLPLVEYMRESEALRERQAESSLGALEAPLAAAGFLVGLALAAAGAILLRRRPERYVSSALLMFVGTVGALRCGIEAGLLERFAGLLSSDWLGNPLRYRPRGRAFNYVNVSTAFFGPALVLAALGYLAGRPRPLVRVVSGLLAVSMLVAFRAPLFNDLIELIPPFSIAANARLSLVGQLCVGVLAGLGLDALSDGARDPRLRRGVLILTLAPMAALVCAHGWAYRDGGVVGDPRLAPAGKGQGQLVGAQLDQVVAGAPAANGAPNLEFSGSFKTAAGVQPEGAFVDIGDGRRVRAMVEPAAAGPDTEDTYRYFARVREWSLASSVQPVRIVMATAKGESVSDPLVRPGAEKARLVLFPVLPTDGRAPQQLSLLAAMIAGVYLVMRLPTAMARFGRIALLAIVAGSVLTFARGYNPSVTEECHFPLNPAIERLQQFGPEERVLVMQGHRYSPELLTWYGVSQIVGYDALVPHRIAPLLRAAIDAPGRHTKVEALPSTDEPRLPLLGMMAVSHVLHPAGSEFEPNPHFLPRARLVRHALLEPDDQRALARLEAMDFPHADTVLLSSGPERSTDAAQVGTVTFELDNPDHIVLRVRAAAPSTLVLADTFFPGWQAFVDGERREIVRANLAFRALAVGPADALVEFRYRPASFRCGLALMFATLAVGLVLLVRSLRRGAPRGGSH